MRQTWTCAVDRDFLQPACWWCWVKFDLIVGAESKRKKETRRGKTYGRMNGVCAYRDNLHSHQLLGLRTLLSFLYPCSGFPGSTFARNVIVAKSSRGSLWDPDTADVERPGWRACPTQGGSILSFHHKDVEKSPFSLLRLLCIEYILMSCVIPGKFLKLSACWLCVWPAGWAARMFMQVTRATETWIQTLT